jgi:hypothetical protein
MGCTSSVMEIRTELSDPLKVPEFRKDYMAITTSILTTNDESLEL